MGDPAGIGLDIALIAWQRRKQAAVPPFFIIGDSDCLEARARDLRLDVPLDAVTAVDNALDSYETALPVLSQPVGATIRPGEPNAEAGPAIIDAIKAGVDLIKGGQASALVTNPINKHVLYQAGFTYPGHTEFLGALAGAWNVKPLPIMMLASDELRVVPVTIHIPLKDVPAALSIDHIVTTVEITVQGLRTDFGIADPRIAVSGLNPHAGEGGSLGNEEDQIIIPALKKLTASGLRISGPRPADAMFHPAARATYDAAVTMYHDQALLPIKTLAFDRAVNVTLGLPFVRTSPDHGTAYDVAATGRASPDSLIAALKLANQIAERRRTAA